jgi:myo-inositol 2-dehydrogenase / D-chiro-inositol 1-dehydrogenase
VKVGLLGAGRIGALHSRLLSEHPDVEQVLVGDVDSAAAERVAGNVGASAGEIDEVIAGAGAAVITAATSAHATLIGLCLDAGLPTFCEKPIALGLEETVEVVERCESEQATLQIGFQRRFDPAFAEARRLVESGELGVLYTLRLATHDPEPPHEEYVAHSGGIFRDLHIHDFDALRWMSCREAREVYAAGSVREFEMFARHGDVDTSAALVTMDDGVLAVLTGGRRDPLGYDVRAELFGSRDSVAVGLESRTPIRSLEPGAEDLLHGERHAHFTARFEHAYRAELSHFLDLARGHAENPCTARDALEALRISLAADKSLAEHRPVGLDEIG